MRKVLVSIATVIGLVLSSNVAFADTAKPGASMTHMKTATGVASTLEAAGVILYVQGGATAAVIGDNLSAATSQVVFHIPVTANKAGVQHVGSNIIFFNTANNQYLTLKNPVIDLAKGVVSATHSHSPQIITSAVSNSQETLLSVGSTLSSEICVVVGFIVLLLLRFSRAIRSTLTAKQFSLPRYQVPLFLSKNLGYLNLNHLQLGIIRI